MSTHESSKGRPLSSFIVRCLLVALATGSGITNVHATTPPGSTSVDAVASMGLGDGTTCVVTVAGNDKCWGRNDTGQLGRGDSTQIGDDESPGAVDFIDLGGLAREIHTNGRQTHAVLETGAVLAWGANDMGELGLGHTQTIGDDETPASANVAVTVQLGGPTTQLAVGADFACALLDGGAVRCWGANDVGQLGYGHTERIGDDESPAQAGDVALGGRAVSLTAGAHHACARLEDGTARCWGLGDAGQLGYGDTDDVGDDERPIDRGPVAVGGSAAIVELVAGESHTCARLETGAVRCWGANDAGQLGLGHTNAIGDDEDPADVADVDVGGTATALAAGARHTCAVLTGGRLRCWGEGLDGRLGYGDELDVGDDEDPADVGDVDLEGRAVASVFAGPAAASTCVQLDDGAVRCWGLGDMGQLGLGDTDSRGDTAETTPARIPDVIVVDDSDD